MSWQRSAVFLLFLFTLSACGFEPLYGSRDAASDVVVPYMIKVNDISGGRPAQELRIQLENLLNPLSKERPPEYVLSAALKEEITPLVIERDRRISRYNLSYTSEYTLTDANTGAVVFTGKSKITGSYDRVESDYATHAAQQDTAIRVMREMAKDIKVRLMAVLARGVQQKRNGTDVKEQANENSGL